MQTKRYIIDLDDFQEVIPRIRQTGVVIVNEHPMVESCCVECTEEQAHQLRSINGVLGVFEEPLAEFFYTQDVVEQEDDYWPLAHICNREGSFKCHSLGRNVDVCVIDSGFNPMHKDLAFTELCPSKPQFDISELNIREKTKYFGVSYYGYINYINNPPNNYNNKGWALPMPNRTYLVKLPVVSIEELTWLDDPTQIYDVEFLVNLAQTQDVLDTLDYIEQPETLNQIGTDVIIVGGIGFEALNILYSCWFKKNSKFVERTGTYQVKIRANILNRTRFRPYEENSGGMLVFCNGFTTSSTGDEYNSRASCLTTSTLVWFGRIIEPAYPAPSWSAAERSFSYRHGQLVVGCAAGNSSGIAKSSFIILLPCRPYSSDLVTCLEAAMTYHAYKIRNNINRPTVVNASWTITVNKLSSTLPQFIAYWRYVCELIDNSGIIFVCAAGNSKEDINLSDYESFPQSIKPETAITVGATTIQNRLAHFSCYGNKVDLFAPGFRVKTTHTNGLLMDNEPSTDSYLQMPLAETYANENRYGSASGTSFASPYTAGVVACALEQNKITQLYNKQDVLQFKQMFLANYTRPWTNIKSFTKNYTNDNIRNNPALLDDPNNWVDGFPYDDTGSPARLLYLPDIVFAKMQKENELPPVFSSYEVDINGLRITVEKDCVIVNGVKYGYNQSFRLAGKYFKVRN